MPITPIQVQAQTERKMSPLEQIALGLGIADKVLNLGLAIPKYQQEKKQRAADIKVQETELGFKTAEEKRQEEEHSMRIRAAADEAEADRQMNDPSSAQSKVAQQLAVQLNPRFDYSSIPASAIFKTIPATVAMYEAEARKQQRLSEAGEHARRVERETGKDERERQDRLNREAEKRQNDFLNSETVKSAKETINAAEMAGNQIITAIQEKNPIAASTAAALVYQAGTKAKRYNKDAIDAFGGSQAITSRIKDMVAKASKGMVPEDELNFMQNLLDSWKKSANQAIKNEAKTRATALARIHTGKTVDEIYSDLTGKEPSGAETKVVNGVTYEKADGGWRVKKSF